MFTTNAQNQKQIRHHQLPDDYGYEPNDGAGSSILAEEYHLPGSSHCNHFQ